MAYAPLVRSGCAVSTLALDTMTFGTETDEKTEHVPPIARTVRGWLHFVDFSCAEPPFCPYSQWG